MTDVCVARCDTGPVLVSVQVTNAGTIPCPAGAVVALRAIDTTGERTLVPGWTAGAVGEVSRGHLGGRLVLASVAWVEDEGFRPNVLTPAIEVFARW